MAVILVLFMAMTNIGMVAIERTHTANAADAGALAGASWLASNSNNAAAISFAMSSAYVLYEIQAAITAFAPLYNHREALDMWTAFLGGQWSLIEISMNSSSLAYNAAQSSAYTYAFINAGIDGKHLDEDKDLGEWLDAQRDDEGKWVGDDKFPWDRSPDELDRGYRKVQVKANVPRQSPIPLFAPLTIFYYEPPPVCVPDTPCAPVPVSFFVPKGIKYVVEVPWLNVTTLPTTTPPVPMPFLPALAFSPSSISLTNDGMEGDDEVKVTVTHTAESADLRLFQMAYHPEYQPIESKATARYGGQGTGKIEGLPAGMPAIGGPGESSGGDYNLLGIKSSHFEAYLKDVR